MNREYEYSFKVKNIEPFIDYCKKNNYNLKNECEQIRTLYTNGGKFMARITHNIYPEYEEELLNFKDDDNSNNILKVSRETEDLLINDQNRKFVTSLLEILELNDIKELKRKRYVYTCDNIKFEIDEYRTPFMNVVAIEGEKALVDKVYNDLKKIIDDNIIYE